MASNDVAGGGSSVKPLFGLETEYGLAAAGPAPSAEDNLLAAGALLSSIRRAVPSLCADRGAGIFLANGARAYVDAHHLEIETPEVGDPVGAFHAFARAPDCPVEVRLEDGASASGGVVDNVIQIHNNNVIVYK